MRARYYAPGYAHFISRDPLGLAAGINLHGYANGNLNAGLSAAAMIRWLGRERRQGGDQGGQRA